MRRQVRTDQIRTAGVSAAELTIAALILGAALVPMYQMFVKGTTTATQSRLAYMALHVAREELEEIRQIPLSDLKPHDWRQVKSPTQDHLFQLSFETRCKAADNQVKADATLKYPKEYERVRTRLGITDTEPPDPRLKLAVLDVKWEETGVGSERNKEAISHFETLLSAHNVEKP